MNAAGCRYIKDAVSKLLTTFENTPTFRHGFESQLRQMSDVNYDFFVHVLMMIYAEKVQKQVVQKKPRAICGVLGRLKRRVMGLIINNFEFE
jgi:hypothetical protein